MVKLAPLERTCVACGKPFVIPRSGGYRTQILCSLKCQRAARHRRGGTVLELSLSDRAWLAGFIDGEGSVILYMRRDSVALRLVGANSYRPALEHAVSICGCGFIMTKPNRNPKHKPGHMWVASGEAAESLLRQMLPHFQIKHEQARLGIDFQERLRTPALKADRSWQLEYRARMQALNRRGPAQILRGGA
jgi:hypothetical protein